MAAGEKRSSKPKKASSASKRAGARETIASKGIKAAGEILQSPIVRNMAAAGIETAVATRAAKARKGAGQQSMGAAIESAVVAVASQAAQRLSSGGPTEPQSGGAATKGGTKPKAQAKPSGDRGTSAAQPKVLKPATSNAAKSGTKKPASSTSSKAAPKRVSSKSSGSQAPARSSAGTKKTATKKPA